MFAPHAYKKPETAATIPGRSAQSMSRRPLKLGGLLTVSLKRHPRVRPPRYFVLLGAGAGVAGVDVVGAEVVGAGVGTPLTVPVVNVAVVAVEAPPAAAVPPAVVAAVFPDFACAR
jgi:hypothetical protein